MTIEQVKELLHRVIRGRVLDIYEINDSEGEEVVAVVPHGISAVRLMELVKCEGFYQVRPHCGPQVGCIDLVFVPRPTGE